MSRCRVDRANLDRPDIRRLIDVTEVYVDEECERIYPGRRSGVARIELRDGRVLEERVLDPKGEGENPMTDDDLSTKFSSNCAAVIGEERTRSLLQLVMGLKPGSAVDGLYRWS